MLVALALAGPARAEESAFPLRYESTSAYVGVVQDRLAWLGYQISPDERAAQRFGHSTLAALRAFERKFDLIETTAVATREWDALKRIAGPVGRLPAACTVSTTICISKPQKLLRFVQAGKVLLTTDARFGIPGQETGNGLFRVRSRSRDHFSSLYETAMPFSLFFNGNQAIHYSSWFARDGYAGGSHGCINLRDRVKAQWVFERSPIGTRVFVDAA